MGLPKSGDAASRFSAYVEGLTSVIGHADRAKPLRDYCVSLNTMSLAVIADRDPFDRTVR
jgi:SRSO17 transposase